jgi:gas vesicle protein
MSTKQCCMFLAGMSCGAAAALLYAPRSGAQLRSQIAGKVSESGRAAKDAVKESVADVRDALERRVDVVDHTIKEGVAAFNEAREVYLNT